MRDRETTPAAVALDTRQRWLIIQLPSNCEGSMSTELYNYHTPGVPGDRVAMKEHARRTKAETLGWPDPGEEPAVKTTILEDNTTAKMATKLWARRQENKAGSGTWMWWTHGSPMAEGRVEAAAVSFYRDDCMALSSCLHMGHIGYSSLNSGKSE
jgi:hypothetical protein